MTRLVGSLLASIALSSNSLVNAAVIARQTDFLPSSNAYVNATSSLLAWQVAGMVQDPSAIASLAASVNPQASSSTSSSLSAGTVKSTLASISQTTTDATAAYVRDYEALNTNAFLQTLLAAFATFEQVGYMSQWYQCAFMGSAQALAAQKIDFGTVWSQLCDKLTTRPASTAGSFTGSLSDLATVRSRLFARQFKVTFSEAAVESTCGSFDLYAARLTTMGLSAGEVRSNLCQSSTTVDAAAQIKTSLTNLFALQLFGVSGDRLYFDAWCQFTNVAGLNAFGIDGQQVKSDACSNEQKAVQQSLGPISSTTTIG